MSYSPQVKPIRSIRQTSSTTLSGCLCSIPREQLRIDDLTRQIETEGVELPLEQLGADSWQLEPGDVTELMAKIRATGVPLAEFAGVEPYRGILTGLNQAFIIDHATRESLVKADPNCRPLIRRNLRGQDFDRWSFDWAGYWLICIPSSENKTWPWSKSDSNSETIFDITYPSLSAHFQQFRDAPIKRQDKGRYWWELRSCAYWDDFDRPKIMYPEITWRAQWGIDREKTVCNNTAYFLPSDDPWILAVANAPVTWWYSWRTAMHGKDEALRFIKDYVKALPIPKPSDEQRATALPMVARLTEVTNAQHAMSRTVLDWLRVEHGIEKASKKLQALTGLDSDSFVAEVKRIRGKKNPLTSAALKSLRDEHTQTIEPARIQAAEALQLERQLSDLVNEAYGLTPDEVALLWQTAPPRMPFTPPNAD